MSQAETINLSLVEENGRSRREDGDESPKADLHSVAQDELAMDNSAKDVLRSLQSERDLRKVLEAKNGNIEALNSLFQIYEPLIKFIASQYFLTGGSIEDLHQEGRLGLYDAINAYDPAKGRFRAFAYLCIRRKIIDAIKAATRFRHHPLNEYVSLSHTPNGQAEDDEGITIGGTLQGSPIEEPSIVVASNEELGTLLRVIEKRFSPLELDVLRLFLEGLSCLEVALELGVDSKKVDNAYTRVRRKLSRAQTAYEEGLSDDEIFAAASAVQLPAKKKIGIREKVDLPDVRLEFDGNLYDREALGLTNMHQISILQIASRLKGEYLTRELAYKEGFFSDAPNPDARNVAYQKNTSKLASMLSATIGRPILIRYGATNKSYYEVAPFEFRVVRNDDRGNKPEKNVEEAIL